MADRGAPAFFHRQRAEKKKGVRRIAGVRSESSLINLR